MKPIIQSTLLVCIVLFGCLAATAQPATDRNYTLTNEITRAGLTTQAQLDTLSVGPNSKRQTITYLDGLGRPVQTVAVKMSPNGKDIITPVVYDAFGREFKKVLPYADSSNAFATFRSSWATQQAAFYTGQLAGVDTSSFAYGVTLFEQSPLNRPLAQGAPGAVWQPNLANPFDASAHVMRTNYDCNQALDSVRIFRVDSAGGISCSGFYPAGQLTVKITYDEQGQQTKAFFDKSGHLLLRRQYIDQDSLQTYDVYDDFGLKAATIQPEGVARITGATWSMDASFGDKWMFLYRYDYRNRLVMRKTPGADSILFIYDQFDRQVLTQDGNQRSQNRWEFTKYDALNRAVLTGDMMDTRGQATIRAQVDTSSGRFETIASPNNYSLYKTFPSNSSYTLTPHTAVYYDDYQNVTTSLRGFFGSGNNTFLLGHPVASGKAILGTSQWLIAVSYYDDRYRIIQTSGDIDTGINRINKTYSFDGKVLQENEILIFGSNYDSTIFTSAKWYTYDNGDRLVKTIQKVSNSDTVTIAEMAYNELGQNLSKKLHQTAANPGPLQKLDYRYNIRGWINGVNQPYSDQPGYEEEDLFNYTLNYTSTGISGSTAQYNGNISEMLWKGGYDEYLRGYKYSYDKANRLTEANYCFKYLNIYNSTTWDYTNRYDEKVDGYDHNGNMQRLERFHGAWTRVDDLSFAGYYNGNKILRITDAVYSASKVGFTDGNAWWDDYRYDANGNMTYDYNKGIDSISHNHLNLPQVISIPGKGTVTYRYDATGMKISKTVVDQTGPSTVTTVYYYRGPAVFKNKQIEYIIADEGRLRPLRIDTTVVMRYNNRKYTYDYFLKDHLGNVRMVLNTEQQTNLYAATMEAAAAAKEEQLFTGLSSTRATKPSQFDTDTSNHYAARLNGNTATSGNYRLGPAIVLKVMARDTVSISTRAWYTGSTQAPPSGLGPVKDLIVSLLSTGVVAEGATHAGSIAVADIEDGLNPIVEDLLDNNQPYDNSAPKAHLNYFFVDEDFKKVTSLGHMGAVQVPLIGSGDTAATLVGATNLVVRRGGWVFAFVSNESNQDVYFDKLVVNHKKGPVEEQTNYYPFGAEIPGLSSHAAPRSTYEDNRYKFNGKEMQEKEFADTSGLNWEDFGARNYDPVAIHWMGIDPMADVNPAFSPYNYARYNPVRYIDPDGKLDRDYYDTDGNWIGTDGVNDGKKSIVLEEKTRDAIYYRTLDGQRVALTEEIQYVTIDLPTEEEEKMMKKSINETEMTGMQEQGFAAGENAKGERALQKSETKGMAGSQSGEAMTVLMKKGYTTIRYDFHVHGAVVKWTAQDGFHAGTPHPSPHDLVGTNTVEPFRVVGWDIGANPGGFAQEDLDAAKESPNTYIPLSNPDTWTKKISFYRNGHELNVNLTWDQFINLIHKVRKAP